MMRQQESRWKPRRDSEVVFTSLLMSQLTKLPPQQQRPTRTSNPAGCHGGGRSSLLSPGGLGRTRPNRRPPGPNANVAGDDGDEGGSESVGDLATARGDGRSNRPPSCCGAGCCSLSPNDLLVAHGKPESQLEDTLARRSLSRSLSPPSPAGRPITPTYTVASEPGPPPCRHSTVRGSALAHPASPAGAAAA